MHYSDVMAVRCVDDRYSPTRPYNAEFGRILSKEQSSDHFLFTSLGGSLEFSQKDCLPGWLYRIETARDLGIKRAVIVDHFDCGAFKKIFGPMNKDQEKAKHLETIAIAKDWFKQNAPDFEFHAYLQDVDKSEKVF